MVYRYAKSILPLLGFLCWNIPPKKEGILSYVLHTILWFHKKVQYGGDGYVLATELLGEENFLSQIGHHPSQIFNSGAEARGSQSCK